MKKVQLTARKIRFYFLIVNQIEKCHFAFTKMLFIDKIWNCIKYFWQAKAYLKQREVAKKNSS